jgi:hypothetical protein
VWDKNKLLYECQHGFKPGYSGESQIGTACQDIAITLNEGARADTIIIDISQAMDLVPDDRLLTKLAASGLDSRVDVRVREFILGRSQRVRVGG